jgi:hypothetical protein
MYQVNQLNQLILTKQLEEQLLQRIEFFRI